ncbi:MAG: aliphatic sulfonate ABC transporter substrate-binding protein [Lachnospiraceae bacterium]|nr:aliphatic sulfonate ABC transporter substrate-binding protein [Lachnospiraceae bacterium]
MKKNVLRITGILALVGALATGCGQTPGSIGAEAADHEASVTPKAEPTAAEEEDSTVTEVEAEEEKDVTEDAVTIRIAVQKSTYSPILTNALGYFDDAFTNSETNVELVEFSQGSAMIESINSDEVDFAFLGDLPAFSGLVNGGEYTIVGKYSEDTAKALVVRKDSGIRSLSDLAGHSYAVNFGSNVQPLAEIFLEEAGLTAADVEYTNLSFADINTALISGDIDAAVQNEPNLSKLLAATDEVEVIARAEGRKVFVGPVIARNEFLASYPATTSEFLAALQKAADWSHENGAEAVEKIAEATGLTPADVETLFALQDNNVYFTAEQLEGLKKGAADAYKYGLLTEELDVEAYIDTSYLEAAGINAEKD